MIKQAIIPLAGLGTRMLPLTSVLPKELLPINGKPNLEYILEECLEAGIKEFILIISKKTGLEVKDISYISPLWTYKVLTFLSALMIVGEIFAFKNQMLSTLNL